MAQPKQGTPSAPVTRRVSPIGGKEPIRRAADLPPTTLEVPVVVAACDFLSDHKDTPNSLELTQTSLCSTVAAQPMSRSDELRSNGTSHFDHLRDDMISIKDELSRLSAHFDFALADVKEDVEQLRKSLADGQASNADRVESMHQRLEDTATSWSASLRRVQSIENSVTNVVEKITSQERNIDQGMSELRSSFVTQLTFDHGMAELQAMCSKQQGMLEQQLVSVRAKTATMEQEVSDMREENSELQRITKEERSRVKRDIAQEVEMRAEAMASLSNEVRDQLANESERVRAELMREMRERMDGYKTLRDEQQLQQQTLTKMSSRIDETLMELRIELPRMGQDILVAKADLERLSKQQLSTTSHIDSLEAALADESRTRQADADSMDNDLRDFVKVEVSHVSDQLSALQENMHEEFHSLTVSWGQSTQNLQKQVKHLEEGAKETGELLQRQGGDVDALQEASEHSSRNLERLQQDLRSTRTEMSKQLEAEISKSEALQDSLDHSSRNLERLQQELRSMRAEISKQLESEISKSEAALGKSMKTMLQENANLSSSLQKRVAHTEEHMKSATETKVAECETALRQWVGSSVIPLIEQQAARIDAHDAALRPKVTSMVVGPVQHAPQPAQAVRGSVMQQPRTVVMQRHPH